MLRSQWVSGERTDDLAPLPVGDGYQTIQARRTIVDGAQRSTAWYGRRKAPSMLRKSAGALLSLLLMAGCGAGAPSTPAGPSGLQDGIPFEKASIQGTITAIGDDGRIRVEEGPEGGSAKALVRITAQTQVRDRNGQAVAEATFVVGMRVRVWYSGPVAESFPVQATAGVVVIDATP